jgi:hypothetical protein
VTTAKGVRRENRDHRRGQCRQRRGARLERGGTHHRAELQEPRARGEDRRRTEGGRDDPVIDGIALDGFYAGDDAAAKSVVATMLAEMGFRPIDTGELLTARVLELMAFLNISLNARNGWPWQSGWKLVGPTG